VAVGSGPQNDIRVVHPEVSRRHCRLLPRPGGFLLEDLGSTNGTCVNGVRLAKPTMVRVGDPVTLGPAVPFPWNLLDPAGTASAPAASSAQRELRVGADADNDVVLNFPSVSGRHLRLILDEKGIMAEDLGSEHGSFLNSRDRRLVRGYVHPSDSLILGSYRISVDELLKGRAGEGDQTLVPFTGDAVELGRDPSADIVLDQPTISRRHCRIRRRNDRFLVEDLSSINGVFVNGVRIDAPVEAGPEDEIVIGRFLIKLTDRGVVTQDRQGTFTLEARDVTLEVGNRRAPKTLLDHISFAVLPGEFCGLMAPSGAGKTTLLRTALGYYRPTSGHVLVNGRDLHREYDAFRTAIGYVPQEDILHADLTVGQALTYSARLRLERDMSAEAIDTLVDSVIERLGLFQANKDIRDTKIANISGGQRRRVNMAIEMLVDPSIFFLDEPTSGLSSEDALIVMQILRELADEGKIIILTLHQPSLEIYKLMDHLIFLHLGGKLVYFGPAMPDSLTFTNPELPPEQAAANPDLALRSIGAKEPEHWRQAYRGSRYFQEYIVDRKGSESIRDAGEGGASRPSSSGLRQWWVLHCRNFRVKLQDRMNTAILLAQAPVIALLLSFAFLPKEGESGFQSAPTALFLMALTAIWFGCSNAARDICGDWNIYQRERMYNLKIPSFVLSKLSVGAMICVIQCLILTLIVSYFCKLRAPFLPLFGVVLITAVAGMSIGLFISAFASPFKKRNEIAIGLTPLVLIPMVVLGGVVKPVKDMAPAVETASMAMASRWSFEAALQLEAEERLDLTPTPQGVDMPEKDVMLNRFFEPDSMLEPLTAIGIIGLIFLLFVIATMLLLKQKDII